MLTDEAGESSTWVTPTATGQSTITAALAPASYQPPQAQQATVLASSSALNLAAVTPTRWIGQGATIAVPLTVDALNQNGVPQANVAVNFAITNGTASLSAASATTNNSGFATVNALLTNQHASVQVSACVAPNNTICSSQPFTLFSTPPSLWTLETVSGSQQVVPTGQVFQPLGMRVTDGSLAANPVMGVNLTFQSTLARTSQNGMPVILGSSATVVVSTQDGLASMVPTVGSVGPCDVFIAVSAGRSSAQFQMETVAAIVVAQPKASGGKPRSATPGPHFSGLAGGPASTPQGAPGMLFAVPEYAPLDEAGSQGPCSGACQDADSNPDSNSGVNRNAAVDNAVPRSCESAPELPKVEAPPAPEEQPAKAIAPPCR